MNANRTIVLAVALLVVGSVPAVVAGSTLGAQTASTDAVGSATGADAVAAQEDTTTEGEQDDATTDDEQDEEQAGEETTAAAGGQQANVTFADQTSNGSAVVVQQVAITATKPAGGFVSIHYAANGTDGAETETDGTAVETTADAGNVTADEIGERIVVSRFLEPGDYQNLTVQLNQTLEEDARLIAVVHRDAQGNEEFDPEADQPFEADGATVADAANVTVSAGDGETAGADDETTTAADE